MSFAHSQAVLRSGAFLEHGPLGSRRLVFVHEDGGIFGDTRSGGLEWRTYRGDKMLGEHFIVW
jgi:hypothetical protein